MTTAPTAPLGAPSAAIRSGQPLVSVIIPCYGEGRYLDDCLHSVRRQTYAQLEILVLDDAGRDDAVAVALEHALCDRRVHVLRVDTNIGLGAIRNLGIEWARGDLLQFLDGDDMLTPDAIRRRVRAFARVLKARPTSEHHRIAGVYGHWHYVSKSADLAHRAKPSDRLGAIDEVTSRGGNIFTVSAPLVRTDVIRSAGGFAENVAGGEDLLAWRRVLATGAVFFANQSVVHLYRQKYASMLRAAGEQVAVFSAAARQLVTETAVAVPTATHPVLADGPGAARLIKTRLGDYTLPWGSPLRTRTRASGLGLPGANGDGRDHEHSQGPAIAATKSWSRLPPSPKPTVAASAEQYDVAMTFLQHGNTRQPIPNCIYFASSFSSRPGADDGEGCIMAANPTGADVLARPRHRPRPAPSYATWRPTTESEGLVAGALALEAAGRGAQTAIVSGAPARRGALVAILERPELGRFVSFCNGDVRHAIDDTAIDQVMTPYNLAIAAAVFDPGFPIPAQGVVVVFDTAIEAGSAEAIYAAASAVGEAVTLMASSSAIARQLSDNGFDIRALPWLATIAEASVVISCGGIGSWLAGLLHRPRVVVDDTTEISSQITRARLDAARDQHTPANPPKQS